MEALEEMPTELPEELRDRVNDLSTGDDQSILGVVLDLFQAKASLGTWETELGDAVRVIDETHETVANAFKSFEFATRERVRGIVAATGAGMCTHERPERGCTACAVRFTLAACEGAARESLCHLGSRLAELSLTASIKGRRGARAKAEKTVTTLAARALPADTWTAFTARRERENNPFGFLAGRLDDLCGRTENGELVLGDNFVSAGRGDAEWTNGQGAGGFELIRDNGTAVRVAARTLLDQLRRKEK